MVARTSPTDLIEGKGLESRRAGVSLDIRNFFQQIVRDSCHLRDSIVYYPIPFDTSLEANWEVSHATELYVFE